MSQHDMTVDNQDFPSTRSDLNNALQALASNSGGTAAPATTFANQWWYDTTNKALKKRNNANTSWIVVSNFDETNGWPMPPIGGGTDTIASASTCDIGSKAASSLSITGTTQISAFGTSLKPGQCKKVTFAAALTLKNNSNIILPGGSDIVTAAGDTAEVECIGSNICQVIYIKINGSSLVSSVGYSSIAGCLPTSISGSSTTAAVSISAGQATDSTNALALVSAGYSWAVSNGNAINGYQGGTTLPNSSTIHFYLCKGTTGTGIFASTSLTPTLPSGYSTSKRRIFSLVTNGAGALLGGSAIEVDGGGMIFYLATQIQDVNTSISTSRSLFAVTAPLGIKNGLIYRFSSETDGLVILTSPDETDIAPNAGGGYNGGFTGVPGFDTSSNSGFSGGITFSVKSDGMLTTNTSAQFGARASNASTGIHFVTRGWKDFRRS